jgi:hypothetical protein
MTLITSNYEAESLEDLADFIDERADEVEAMAEGCKTQRESRRRLAQAGGLRMAARIVRNTTITPKS